MYLSNITLKNFRSYRDASFKLDQSVTLVTGQNGAGKTNLLEAIYVLLQGGSFRVNDQDMVRHSESWWRVDGVINGGERQVRYQVGHRPPKQLLMQDKSKRFMYTDRLPVVLFEPNDLQLIHGSPSRRRDSLDAMLVALSSSYKTILAKYERTLRQRNNALKGSYGNVDDLLFSWDVLLSEYGVTIMQARTDLIARLNQSIGGYYSQIAGDAVELELGYHSVGGSDVNTSAYMSHLYAKRQIDALRATTSYGPHRDDMTFSLRRNDARHTASRGEIRTILLSLKLAFASLMEVAYDQPPLILLDDVMSELDAQRQTNLLKVLDRSQVVITDTKSVAGAALQIRL